MMVIVPLIAQSNHTPRQLCRRSGFHCIPTLRIWKNRRMPLPMKITARALLCCLLLLGSTAAVPALNNQVGREQDIVGLRLGQRVMVDDGSCPQGQIKEVHGAKMTDSGVAMSRKCVPRSGPKTSAPKSR
jgi:Family of unknown function (DUF6719)